MVRFAVIIAALILAGCARSPISELGRLYNRGAQEHDDVRNPVILIPGILGSRLMAGDRVVWGAFGGEAADPAEPDDARLIALPFVRSENDKIEDLSDDVDSVGALDSVDVRLFGLINIQQRAYRNILLTLGAGMYRDQELGEAGAVDYGDDHYTCFQFHYDWRRDLVANVARLDAFIAEARAKVREHRPVGEINFDIVAHSMGGLLARYYLRYGSQDLPEDGDLPDLTWAGANQIERLIMVGTPNAGSAEAITQLVNGFQPAPLLPVYDPAILGSFPSIFQLLPRSRHRPLRIEGRADVDLFDVDLWIDQGWGLANPDVDSTLAVLLPDVSDPASRREIALRHLRKSLERAERFHHALDTPASTPEGIDIYLFLGDAIQTAATTAPGPDRSAVVTETAPGDGTVIRTSAFSDERVGGVWTRTLQTPIDFTGVQILFSNHLELTKDPVFVDNVLYLLLEDPRRRSSAP